MIFVSCASWAASRLTKDLLFQVLDMFCHPSHGSQSSAFHRYQSELECCKLQRFLLLLGETKDV